MLYLVIGNAAVFLVEFVFANVSLRSLLDLRPARVLEGEVWRIVTFVFVPEYQSAFSIIMSLYFYYMIGTILESAWGSFRLNAYYFAGMAATIIAALLSALIFPGSGVYAATAANINLTLFLALASIAPDMRFMLFFFIPIKAKWLGALSWAFLAFQFITAGSAAGRLVVAAPLAGYLLFFWESIALWLKRSRQLNRRKRYFVESKLSANESLHRCAVCGITEHDAPDMEFRFCSKCNGDYEYCEKHLHSHEHVQ
jgi:membrane associated rhomboid family serine protease